MDNAITCPHCGETVEITAALKHQLEEKTIKELQEKHEQELEQTKKNALEESSKKIQEQFERDLAKSKEDTLLQEEQRKKLLEEMTEMAKTIRSLKTEKDEMGLLMEKKLAEEEEKIRSSATKKAEEEQHLKILEKDKQLQDAIKANEELRRKLQQGSQQMQGEVFELEFEKMLHQEFPNDKISEVAKGTRGGDIVQEVWDRNGNFCGKILWELKNTKTWSDLWVEKLRADQRTVTAEFAVIISEALPNNIDGSRFYKNIWVTKRSFVLGLADALRVSLIKVAGAKRAIEGKKEKSDVLYSYLSGTEFQHRVEAIVEAFSNMQTEIEKEKRYFANKWARDEKNIRQVIDNTYGMHGDLKGIMGENTIPERKGLDILELTDSIS